MSAGCRDDLNLFIGSHINMLFGPLLVFYVTKDIKPSFIGPSKY